MKSRHWAALTFVTLGLLCSSLTSAQSPEWNGRNERVLADLYRYGKLRLVPEIVLDDSSLPEDAVLEIPVGVISDAAGNIYVLDQKAHNIKKFDSSGRFLKRIGRRGQGPGDFSSPSLFSVAEDRFVVWDMDNMRICTLTLDGEFLDSTRIGYLDPWPCKIRGLPGGNILIERYKSYRTDRPQDFLLEIYSPELELLDILLKEDVWRRRFNEPSGRTMPAPFADYVHWDVTADGKIALAFSNRNEIEIRGSEGDTIAAFSHPYDPVAVNEQDKLEFFKGIIYTIDDRRVPYPESYKKATKFPEYKPSFFRMFLDSQGNVLVSRYRKNRSIEGRTFDVFASDGEFLSSVRFFGISSFPRYYERFCFSRTKLWVCDTDPDGLFRLTRYKIVAFEDNDGKKSHELRWLCFHTSSCLGPDVDFLPKRQDIQTGD
jgi:hypothetical protein